MSIRNTIISGSLLLLYEAQCSINKLLFASIIAVHGLNGHAYGTWAFQPDNKGGFEAMWLRDFLPYRIPNARIIIYGYNSTLIGPNTSVSNIKDFASDLLERLLDDRKHAEVGGLLISVISGSDM